jgi:hypothetical protein
MERASLRGWFSAEKGREDDISVITVKLVK